ncbi:MAG: signal peptidase II [Lachnospiraceae bacterium]|nr:signal peptidase II [Lachnospiraceae bacterium]
MKEKKIKIMFLPIIFVALLTSIDQLTKYIIKSKFVLFESKEVIKNIFAITYIHNEGAAWGVMKGGRIFFLILTSLVVVGCFYILYNIIGNRKYIMLTICIITLISGAVGNMIDRFEYGYVIDFLDFKMINFPVFNVADIYVTVSMIVVLVLMIFVYKEEDINYMLGKKAISEETIEDTNESDNKADIVNNTEDNEESIEESIKDTVEK